MWAGQVTFADKVLTIKGEKRIEKQETKGGHHLAGHSNGSLHRAFELPPHLAADKIDASFAKAVLELPQTSEADGKLRHIDVKGAQGPPPSRKSLRLLTKIQRPY
jgi:HSP20 family protein